MGLLQSWPRQQCHGQASVRGWPHCPPGGGGRREQGRLTTRKRRGRADRNQRRIGHRAGTEWPGRTDVHAAGLAMEDEEAVPWPGGSSRGSSYCGRVKAWASPWAYLGGAGQVAWSSGERPRWEHGPFCHVTALITLVTTSFHCELCMAQALGSEPEGESGSFCGLGMEPRGSPPLHSISSPLLFILRQSLAMLPRLASNVLSSDIRCPPPCPTMIDFFLVLL